MAKDRKKTIHIHSSIEDRQPIASLLEVGELGVNNYAGKEFISTKNTAGSVVRFSSDEQIVSLMEHKEVIPYSGVVDNIDLENNRSNIEIKFNQVAASSTTKHDVVNGAKDIDGDLVNPTSDSGLTNGAGFAIDMSRYAMIDANPSFSSVTISGAANISGNTTIGGNTYLSGNTYFNNHCNDIEANELSEAICEVFEKSVVTINKVDNPSDPSLIAKYQLSQNGAQIGDIDIPKGDSLSSYTLTLTHNGLENAVFDPFIASLALTLPHSALTATYGATSGKSGSVTFNTSADTAISIPTCVNHLNRHNITFQSGSTASFNNQTYDPGKDCANSAETINIPTSITHLKEWDDSTGCLGVAGCVRATNFYQTSDVNYKENIRKPEYRKMLGAHDVPIVRFNFKDDPEKTDVYGVIAQEVEEKNLKEIVVSDEFGKKSVDYTSLMALKIAYLEFENNSLRTKLSKIEERISKLEDNSK